MIARPLYLALVAGALLLAAAPGAAQTPQMFQGRLGKPTASVEKATREHSFEAAAGQRIEVTLKSPDFDAYLELIPPAGDAFYREPLANDDYGEGTDSRVRAVASGKGTWRAVVSAFDETEGGYELSIVLGEAGRITNVERRMLGEADSVSMKGRRYASYSITLEREAQLLVEMISEDFAPVIIVESPSGARSTSESEPDGSAARLDIGSAERGRWRILATQELSDEPASGAYALRMIEVPIDESNAVTGALEAGDPKDIDGEFYDVHRVPGSSDRPLVIQLFSSEFDAYLSARSPSGQWFRDDDGAGDTNARLALPALSGEWFVVVTSYSGGEGGRYRLTIGR